MKDLNKLPLYCTECGSPLKEIEKEYDSKKFDPFTGKKLPAVMSIHRACSKNEDHDVWFKTEVSWVKL